LKNILLIEDEFLIQFSLSHVLKSEDVQVTCASTGREALGAIGSAFFDLCCLDIGLPDMSGVHVMQTIKRESPATKIIMMTGGEVNAAMRREMNRDAELLLFKPFDLYALKGLVHRILNLEHPSDTGESSLTGNYNAFEYWLLNNQRGHDRRTMTGRVSYASADGKDGEPCRGTAIDVSDGGIGIATTSPLAPGLVLKLYLEGAAECVATVRWSMNKGPESRAGLQFISPGKCGGTRKLRS
jgi:CheY-like chemotaxis protein